MADRANILQLARAHQIQLHPAVVKRLVSFLSQYDVQDRNDLLGRLLEDAMKGSATRVLSLDRVESFMTAFAAGGTGVQRATEVVRDPPTAIADVLRGTIEVRAASRHTAAVFFQNRVALTLIREGNASGVTRVRALEGIAVGRTVRVLGLLSRRALDGQLSIEDVDAVVPVAPLEGQTTVGYILPGMVVVASGRWTGNAIEAAEFSHPTAHSFASTRAFVGIRNLFGGSASLDVPIESASVCLIADVHLGSSACVGALRKMFTTCESHSLSLDLANLTFVLCGPFFPMAPDAALADPSSGSTVSSAARRDARAAFELLAATILSAAPTVAAQAQFVFVPGPGDFTGSVATFPQRPLSQSVASSLNRLHNARLAPNPVRLRSAQHELIVARCNFQRALVNQTLTVPTPTLPHFEHIARTFVGQGDLSVDAFKAGAAQRQHTNCYPAPHMLCLCDTSSSWQSQVEGTVVLNPGSFSASRSFAWCNMADNAVEFHVTE
jgi:hypothetical protein